PLLLVSKGAHNVPVVDIRFLCSQAESLDFARSISNQSGWEKVQAPQDAEYGLFIRRRSNSCGIRDIESFEFSTQLSGKLVQKKKKEIGDLIETNIRAIELLERQQSRADSHNPSLIPPHEQSAQSMTATTSSA